MTYDVIILGGGLAGLTLARHLLLYTSKTILLLDKRADLPGPHQKVGESLVQLSGFYLGKVLDLEEYLLVNHYLKYNLRFYWRSGKTSNTSLEDYSMSFIRQISNIPTYQLDRNKIEAHLLAANLSNPRFFFEGGARNIEVDIGSDLHTVRHSRGEVRARWVIDASGRPGVLKKKFGLALPNAIRHGATWCWVDGLVNIEKLTDRPLRDIINNTDRRKQGHFPMFLATNHFCDEGMWFWVIPLHGITSLGLVYEHRSLSPARVSNTAKMLDYVCRTWPLFARDLPHRKVVAEGRYVDYSFDSKQTISVDRWALCGEAGRFTDPLYSPGSDLIAIYNTLIVDCIEHDDPRWLESACPLYEQIMRTMYESYVPGYALSYDCLGDQEAFTLKYTWELAVYFVFLVFPFANHLFTNHRFMRFLLSRYGELGPINRNLQTFLSGFFQWKKSEGPLPAPQLVEFYDMLPLRESEKLFYESGRTPAEAEALLDYHLESLKEFARYIIAHVHAVVLNDRSVLTNARFIENLKLRTTSFDPAKMREQYSRFAGCQEMRQWKLNPFALEPYLPAREQAMEMTA